MLVILLCVVISCVLLWVCLKWIAVKKFWFNRNVPHNPPHPILGSLTFLQKENPAFWMRRIYDEFQSPYVGVWLFWRPALVVNTPELAKRILVKDADLFRNRLCSSGKTDPIGGLNLFTVNDPLWTDLRKHLTIVYTGSKLRAMHNISKVKCEDLIRRILTDTKNGVKIDMRSLFADFTTDVFGETAFGLASNATATGRSAMRQVTKEFMKFSVFRGFCWSSLFFFPEVADYFGFTFFSRSSSDYLTKVFKAIVEKRGGYDAEVHEVKDLLDALIKMKQLGRKNNEEMSEELLVAQAAIFLQGGFDTSAGIITFALYELAFQPHIQEILYNELKEAKQQIDHKDFDSAMLAELPYLNAVIKESLRKYPPLGWLDRVASKDYKINENLTISAGTPVYVNAIGMHFDPQYFPDPEKFDPDRFLPENEENLKPYTFMPFGEGPRNCIGKRFGYQSVRYALSTVMLNYSVSPFPDTPIPEKCHFESKGLLLMPDEVLSVEFVPRKSE